MNFRIRQGVNGWFLVLVFSVLFGGCVQSSTIPTKPINTLPPNTVAGIVAKAGTDARAERSALAKSIAEEVKAGTLKTPAEQGEAWNKSETSITAKENATISTTLKAAFGKADAAAVWLELAKGYQLQPNVQGKPAAAKELR